MPQNLSSPRWLTDELAICGLDLMMLGWDHESLEMSFNRRIPTFDIDELIACVVNDLQHGLLKLTEASGAWIPDPDPGFVGRLIRQGPQWTASLWFTEQGGRRWEADSRADWKRFINHGTDESEDGTRATMVIESMRADRIRRFLDTLLAINYVPLHQSIRVKQVSPWKATYWKTLPRCHRLTVRCDIDPEIGPPGWQEKADAFRDALTWYEPGTA